MENVGHGKILHVFATSRITLKMLPLVSENCIFHTLLKLRLSVIFVNLLICLVQDLEQFCYSLIHMVFRFYEGASGKFLICTIFHQIVLLNNTTRPKDYDTVLIKTSMVYFCNIIGSFFDLLKEIFNLVTSFFYLLVISGTFSLITF